jgi:PAS domain S-box-containing protein
MDAMVLGGTFAAAMYVIALFGLRLFEIIPVSRRTVIEQMREGMMVLDVRQRIVDLNRATETILGLSAAQLRGRPAEQVMQPLVFTDPSLENVPVNRTEIRVHDGEAHRRFALQSSPLSDRHGRPLGSLILLHDVTAEHRARALLLDQQRAVAVLHERDRVARELHDSIGQILGFVKMQVQAARALLSDRPTEADALLAQAAAVAQDAHADVREYILGARTGLSAHVDLLDALREYLGHFSDHHGIQASLTAPQSVDVRILEPTTQVQLLRIIQEALTNVRKHGRAKSVRVRLGIDDGYICADIIDDGLGFDPAQEGKRAGHTFGLRFMRERAEEVGGSVEVASTPGNGTRVTISVPMRRAPP